MFGLRTWLRRRAAARAPVPDALWMQALGRCRVIAHLDDAALARLRELVTLFLVDKTISGAAGLELTEAMRLQIALQACVPILELGIDSYAPWIEVIVYPDEFIVEREITDENGIVHEVREPLAGESWVEGPVILSWADIESDAPEDGYNVILHEFAHKLDMLDGQADGMPPLHAGMNRHDWHEAFANAFDDFERRVARVERAERRAYRRWRLRAQHAGQDPAAEGAGCALAQEQPLPLDPYAAHDAGEFFACASEAFFETPQGLYADYPEVYRQLVRFYRQDPAGHGEA